MNNTPIIALSPANQVMSMGHVVLCVTRDSVQVDSKLPKSTDDLITLGQNLHLILTQVESRIVAQGGML